MDLHRAQDLQSLLMHQEAVRLVRSDPRLVERLQETLSRWSARSDPNSRPLLERWFDIVARQEWDLALADTEEAQQLRQASPMATVLPEETRLAIIGRVRDMKAGRR
jgi:hypothetical protein